MSMGLRLKQTIDRGFAPILSGGIHSPVWEVPDGVLNYNWNYQSSQQQTSIGGTSYQLEIPPNVYQSLYFLQQANIVCAFDLTIAAVAGAAGDVTIDESVVGLKAWPFGRACSLQSIALNNNPNIANPSQIIPMVETFNRPRDEMSKMAINNQFIEKFTQIATVSTVAAGAIGITPSQATQANANIQLSSQNVYQTYTAQQSSFDNFVSYTGVENYTIQVVGANGNKRSNTITQAEVVAGITVTVIVSFMVNEPLWVPPAVLFAEDEIYCPHLQNVQIQCQMANNTFDRMIRINSTKFCGLNGAQPAVVINPVTIANQSFVGFGTIGTPVLGQPLNRGQLSATTPILFYKQVTPRSDFPRADAAVLIPFTSYDPLQISPNTNSLSNIALNQTYTSQLPDAWYLQVNYDIPFQKDAFEPETSGFQIQRMTLNIDGIPSFQSALPEQLYYEFMQKQKSQLTLYETSNTQVFPEDSVDGENSSVSVGLYGSAFKIPITAFNGIDFLNVSAGSLGTRTYQFTVSANYVCANGYIPKVYHITQPTAVTAYICALAEYKYLMRITPGNCEQIKQPVSDSDIRALRSSGDYFSPSQEMFGGSRMRAAGFFDDLAKGFKSVGSFAYNKVLKPAGKFVMDHPEVLGAVGLGRKHHRRSMRGRGMAEEEEEEEEYEHHSNHHGGAYLASRRL